MGKSVVSIEFEGNDMDVIIPESDPRSVMVSRQDDGTVKIGWLAHDVDAGNPLESMDGEGRIYTSRKNASPEEHAAFRKALGLDDSWNKTAASDSDAIPVDVYQHGATVFSVAGEGVQCQFDTARSVAVWVPDEALLSEAEHLAVESPERRAFLFERARSAIALYNEWENGECYGIVFGRLDGSAVKGDSLDSSWGYVGRDDAERALREELGIPEISREPMRKAPL